MENIIFKLYDSLNKEDYNNRVNSTYWIYQVESVFTKHNGISKRYLKIYFFNKHFNENNNLMRLYLNINGESLEINKFSVASEYNNPNVMGFVYEIDLLDERKDIDITGYIYDGKKVELSDTRLHNVEVKIDNDLSVLNDFYMQDKKALVFPTIKDSYWMCTCGCINGIENETCTHCLTSKEEIRNITNMDMKQLTIKEASKKLHIVLNKDIDSQINEFAKGISNKYGVVENDLIDYLHVEELRNTFEHDVEEDLVNRMHQNPMHLNTSISLEENIQKYIHTFTNEVVTDDMVKQKLDISDLENQYNIKKTEIKIKIKKFKKIAIICVAVIALCIVGVNLRKLFFPNTQEQYETAFEKLQNLDYVDIKTVHDWDEGYTYYLAGEKMDVTYDEDDYDSSYVYESSIQYDLTSSDNIKFIGVDKKDNDELITHQYYKDEVLCSDRNKNTKKYNTDSNYINRISFDETLAVSSIVPGDLNEIPMDYFDIEKDGNTYKLTLDVEKYNENTNYTLSEGNESNDNIHYERKVKYNTSVYTIEVNDEGYITSIREEYDFTITTQYDEPVFGEVIVGAYYDKRVYHQKGTITKMYAGFNEKNDLDFTVFDYLMDQYGSAKGVNEVQEEIYNDCFNAVDDYLVKRGDYGALPLMVESETDDTYTIIAYTETDEKITVEDRFTVNKNDLSIYDDIAQKYVE